MELWKDLSLIYHFIIRSLASFFSILSGDLYLDVLIIGLF